MLYDWKLHHCTKKNPTIHQITTMLATSKVLIPGHNHLLAMGTDDPLLHLGNNQSVGLSVPVVNRWLWPGIMTFLEVASIVVNWWTVAFLRSACSLNLSLTPSSFLTLYIYIFLTFEYLPSHLEFLVDHASVDTLDLALCREGHVDEVEAWLETSRDDHTPTARRSHGTQQEHVLDVLDHLLLSVIPVGKERVIISLSNWLTNRLANLLIDWLIDWLTDHSITALKSRNQEISHIDETLSCCSSMANKKLPERFTAMLHTITYCITSDF